MTSDEKDVETYLARIRKTIEESEKLISQTELRIAETDRLLESQGLTREQVMAMRFSEAQLDAANEELRRRGMTPLEKWALKDAPEPKSVASYEEEYNSRGLGVVAGANDELEARQKKFSMFMKPFQI